jgi:hypothetical protein
MDFIGRCFFWELIGVKCEELRVAQMPMIPSLSQDTPEIPPESDFEGGRSFHEEYASDRSL